MKTITLTLTDEEWDQVKDEAHSARLDPDNKGRTAYQQAAIIFRGALQEIQEDRDRNFMGMGGN